MRCKGKQKEEWDEGSDIDLAPQRVFVRLWLFLGVSPFFSIFLFYAHFLLFVMLCYVILRYLYFCCCCSKKDKKINFTG